MILEFLSKANLSLVHANGGTPECVENAGAFKAWWISIGSFVSIAIFRGGRIGGRSGGRNRGRGRCRPVNFDLVYKLFQITSWL